MQEHFLQNKMLHYIAECFHMDSHNYIVFSTCVRKTYMYLFIFLQFIKLKENSPYSHVCA